MLHLLPQLTKLDNDDVTAEDRLDNPQTAQQATEPQPSASTVPLSTEQSPSVASQPLLGPKFVPAQVQPAKLQAALAISHQVLCYM